MNKAGELADWAASNPLHRVFTVAKRRSDVQQTLQPSMSVCGPMKDGERAANDQPGWAE